MSFGLSPSDVLNFAKLCYDVYTFSQEAPANLEELFKKLERVAQKLTRFSANLKKSGWGTWNVEPVLKTQLDETRVFLENLVSKPNSVSSKLKSLVSLKANEDKLHRHERNLELIEKAIDDTKIDLILACTLKNLQSGSDHQSLARYSPWTPKPGNVTTQPSDARPPRLAIQPAHARRLLDDQLSTRSEAASKASRAVMMAVQLESQLRQSVEAPVLRTATPKRKLPNAQTSKLFIESVVSVAEKNGLYVENTDPMQNLEPLNEITREAKHLQDELGSSTIEGNDGAEKYQIPALAEADPESLKHQIFRHLSWMSDSTSLRVRALDHSQRSQSETSGASTEENPTGPSSVSDPAPLTDLAIINDLGAGDDEAEEDLYGVSIRSNEGNTNCNDDEPPTHNVIFLVGRAKVSLRKDPASSFTCLFKLESAEGSIKLKVMPSEPAISDIEGHSTSEGLPSSSTVSSSSNYTGRRIAFYHVFEPQARPIPHLLHPSVEGPMKAPTTPYAITFTERQYISAEPRWTTSLMYIFDEEQDRTTLCESIFGKTLAICVGANKVIYDGKDISHMSAVALWFDSVAQTCSITFSANLTSRTATPKDKELLVHGLWDGKPAGKDPKVAMLAVEPMEAIGEVLAARNPQRSVISGRTSKSKASSSNPARAKKPVRWKCTIEFTKSGDQSEFLRHLAESPLLAK